MTHQKTVIALKKARSLIDKVMQMVEDDTYCIDIIQQNLAIIWLLKSSNLKLLEWHMDDCVRKAIVSWDTQKVDKKMQEILKIVNLAQSK